MYSRHPAFYLLALLCFAFPRYPAAQNRLPVYIHPEGPGLITIQTKNQVLTQFRYADSLEKPVLFPVYTLHGETITRGFPLAPRPGESQDHPHHEGLWMNYEVVNGLDFWNNSYAIPEDRKDKYGWIHTDSVYDLQEGVKATLAYAARWTDRTGHLLLEEHTRYEFQAYPDVWVIDRITALRSVVDVSMPDSKDGLLGLRVNDSLTLPTARPQQFTDAHGTITVTPPATGDGNYVTSAGKTGDSAWGTRASWCMLYGKLGADSVHIVIIDHPDNPGYPTYWHARGYGLFAANPLGEKIFSRGKDSLNFFIKKGDTKIFRYRILIASSRIGMPWALIRQFETAFARKETLP